MGAYNWILIDAICPNCGKTSVICAQTHVGATYSGNDNTRFHDNYYKPGDMLLWFDRAHPSYHQWKQGNHINVLPDNLESECCYSKCTTCKLECYAVVAFNDLKITQVEIIGTLDKWSETHYK